MEENTGKCCGKCGVTKPLSDYPLRRDRKNLRVSNCKSCRYSATNEWWHKNSDRAKALRAKHARAVTDPQGIYQKKWRSENIERKRAYERAHYENNKDKFVVKCMNRRAAALLSGGRVTRKEIQELLIKQRSRCAVCKTSLADGFHRDHITALSVGGANDITNIQLLCPPCNLSKGAKDPAQFMRSKGLLI